MLMRTRSFMDIAAALLLVLGGKRALVAAGSSTERGPSAPLYTPPSVSEPGDTSASPFHTDSTGVTSRSPVESEASEREPEPERHSGTASELKHKVQSNGNMNEEGFEFSSPMASTYIFSIIKQAQQRVSPSGITKGTTPYNELNSSKVSTQTASEIYETSSRSSSSQATLLDSAEISPQTSTHIPSQTSAQPSSPIYSQTSPQNSPRVSHSSAQTSSLLSVRTSFQASSEISSQTSFQTSFQTLSQTSLQTTSEASAQRSPLTSTKSVVWDTQSMNTDSQDRVNETTSLVLDQLDTRYGYYNPPDSSLPSTQSNTQYTDVTQQSLDTISQDALNSTVPHVSDDTMMATEIMQYSTMPDGVVVHSENITLPSVPHNLSTEASISSTSQLVNENVASSTGNMEFTAEPPTDFFYTHEEANTVKDNISHLTSTVVSPVIITAADDSLIKAPSSHFPFTVGTEEHGDTTTDLSRNHWTGTQMSESSKENSSKTTDNNITLNPPNVPSTTAWAQTPVTTQTTTQKTQTPSSRSSTSQNLLPTWTTRTFSQNSSGTGLMTQHVETTTAMPGNTTGYKASATTAYSHTTPVPTTTKPITKHFKERVTADVAATTFRSIGSKAPAKTFLGTFFSMKLSNSSFDLHEIQREILQLLNSSLSGIKGYSSSMLRKSKVEEVHISVVNTFLTSAEVTRANVLSSIQMYLKNCSQAISHCRSVLRLSLSYNDESLCAAQKTQCNPQRAECTDVNGLIVCQCHSGYFKQSADDMSCIGCGDGYKLENSTCVP